MSKQVTVIAPKNEGHEAMWAAGMRFVAGATEIELTQEQIDRVASKPGFVVIVDGKQYRPAKAPSSLTVATLTAEERELLEQHRSGRMPQRDEKPIESKPHRFDGPPNQPRGSK